MTMTAAAVWAARAARMIGSVVWRMVQAVVRWVPQRIQVMMQGIQAMMDMQRINMQRIAMVPKRIAGVMTVMTAQGVAAVGNATEVRSGSKGRRIAVFLTSITHYECHEGGK